MIDGTLTSGPLTLALIGAGQAGRSLAAEAVHAGHRVVLEDVLPSRLRDALSEIETAGQLGSLHLATTVEEAVREADLVIDFVPDELESKLEIISMVDRMAPPRTVICMPTHALSITDLAACTYRADRCIAVQLEQGTTTLITGPKTSDATTSMLNAFFKSLGHTTNLTQDAPIALTS